MHRMADAARARVVAHHVPVAPVLRERARLPNEPHPPPAHPLRHVQEGLVVKRPVCAQELAPKPAPQGLIIVSQTRPTARRVQ